MADLKLWHAVAVLCRLVCSVHSSCPRRKHVNDRNLPPKKMDGIKRFTFGLFRPAGHNHLDAGDVGEERLWRLGVVVAAMAHRTCPGKSQFSVP